MMDAQAMTRSPKGEVTIRDGRMTVVFRRSYRKPVEKVWAALTVPERLQEWFGDAKIDLREGGTCRFTYANGFSTEVKIFRVDEPRAFGWTWRLDDIDTSVLFELTPRENGCDLVLTHSNVDANGRSGGIKAGWHTHLEGLADCLEGRTTPWSLKEEREKAIAPLYETMGA